MEKFNERLESALKKDKRFVSDEGDLMRNAVVNAAYDIDDNLISMLLSDDAFKDKFFKQIKGNYVFNILLFENYVRNKHFFIDSHTKFKNHLGLTIDGKALEERSEVALVWPFKDCILEGGMDNGEAQRKEIFFNEILAEDEITRLLDPKVLTNGKKYGAKGEKPFDKFSRDENGTITDNLIIKGNNLVALHSLYEEFAGKVKLIYIDPPYNTGGEDFRYNNNFNHSTWLTFMRNRLEIADKLMSKDGSIYVNIDYNEAHYLKILMDEVFGRDCFKREIIWRIGWLSGYKTLEQNYIRNHDTILFYTKDPKNFIFNKKYNTKEDFIERFSAENKSDILKKLQDLELGKEERENFFKYISEIGLPEKYPLEDTWNSSIYDKLNSIAVVSYSGEKVSKMLGVNEIKGQKSEKLLQRIIEASTNEGDIVLDYHMGSGTTCAVAHKLNRKYIGIEQMKYIKDTTVERLKKVVEGENVGISKNVGWKGGGEFTYFELKEYNQEFINRIQEAKNSKKLLKIWEDMKIKSFPKHNADFRKIDSAFEEWKKLDLEKQQKCLIELLDKNHLYVNHSEIEDNDFACTDEEKHLTQAFYKGV